jgi:tetratricopeptide (TPR) repeat protein
VTDASDNPFTILNTPPQPRNTVAAGDVSGAPGATIDVPVLVTNDDTAGLVGAHIWYDHSVVQYVSQSARASSRGLGMQVTSIASSPDTVRVSIQQSGGVTLPPGDGEVALLTFRLVGAGGTQSALRLSHASFQAPDGSARTVRTQNGSITVLQIDTPLVFTNEGWTAFEAGNLDLALEKFNAAIGLDAQYGPAYTGRGWVQLSRATAAGDFSTAVASFDAAVARGEGGGDVLGGRAAARLALGGDNLAEAVQDAETALAGTPAFVFAHRVTFDYRDLHLVAAFAEAGRGGRFPQARTHADQVQASNITQGNPQSWTVDGVTYPTFEAAVLAWLHKMSVAYSG